jgi:hypothetical protein
MKADSTVKFVLTQKNKEFFPDFHVSVRRDRLLRGANRLQLNLKVKRG